VCLIKVKILGRAYLFGLEKNTETATTELEYLHLIFSQDAGKKQGDCFVLFFP